MSPPSSFKLIQSTATLGPDESYLEVNSLPAAGQAPPSEALPVISAQGVSTTRRFVPIPKFVLGDATTIVLIVDANVNRRFLRLINNSAFDIELWSGLPPGPTEIGKDISRGEILYAQGGGIEDFIRVNSFYATSANGVSGLVVLEG